MDLYTAIVVITVALLSVTIVDIRTNRVIDSNMKRSSIIVCLLICLSIFFEWAGVKTNGAAPSLITTHKFVKLAEFCLSPLVSVMATISYSRVEKPKIVAAIMTAHIAFEIVAIHFGAVIFVDEANIYHRGNLYFIYIAVFSASIIYCFASMVREEMRQYAKPSPVLMATLLFLSLGIGLQMISSELRIDYMCVAMGNYFLYNHRCKTIMQMDGLTHLLNRRCFEKDIEKISSPVVVLNMDVNKFKSVNDTYGHSVGDLCLTKIADLIRKSYGKYGACYRCGGDEFCVILKRNINRLPELNRDFQNSVRQMRQIDDKLPDVAMGYAYFDSKTEHIKDALKKADEMMYSNKRNARE